MPLLREDSGVAGKYWVERGGAGLAKDLKVGIELGSPWAQLRYMSMH